MGHDLLQDILRKQVVGMAEMRSRQAEVLDMVSNHYETVFLRDNKRCACSRSAVLIAPDLLKQLLLNYTFSPELKQKDGRYEIHINEICAYGKGETKNKAVKAVIEDILEKTCSYFSRIDLNARLPEKKKQYPWFLKILMCLNEEMIKETVDIKDYK